MRTYTTEELNGVDLRKAILRKANLRYANLRYADLREPNRNEQALIGRDGDEHIFD